MKVIIKRHSAFITLAMMVFNLLIPFQVSAGSNDELIFPLKEISKLDCRFEEFDDLSSSCKRTLPVLTPDNYSKYSTANGGYNEYTRIYTVLWGSSYKYGWDVWNGGHQGTDIATAKWTPVYSIADGIVIEAASDISWGNYISIEHTISGKKVISNYAHLSKLNVSSWDKIDVGDKIWEVWSTGNSTGNHLHFQIDLPNTFHPYYYDWNECPYSYYEITENGVCFDVLDANTFDPLEFLSSNWGILDAVQTTTSSSSQSTSTTSSSTSSYTDIFDTTVYYGYGNSSDVKEIMRIYNKLWYYDWRISGDFEDIEESIIAYQLATGVLENKSDDGAGWFGPKTRTQTETDYDAYVASGGQSVLAVSTQTKTTAKEKQEVQKVSRENLMTREEIQAQEMEEFLDIYDINFKDFSSHMSQDELQITTLRIENSREKGFKWNTPWNVTFAYDSDIVSIFPESFYNFTNGEREINITGKKSWHTNITVKIGEVIVKTFSLSVWELWEKPTASSANIYMSNSTILWEKNTGIIVMKDQYENSLIKSEYSWDFSLSDNDNVKYCIKKGRLQDIKTIYKRECFDDEYKNTLDYNYDDTIEWVLIFDYKVLTTENINLELNTSWKNIANKQISVETPKWLAKSYEYYDEVIETLTAGITDGINSWYFLENRLLSQADAVWWIENISWDNLTEEQKMQTQNITREGFLELTYKYLWNNTVATVSQDYRDMQWENELLVASLLWETYQWKDSFWENYFQPDKEITRWEAAYMLSQALQTQWYSSLAVK